MLIHALMRLPGKEVVELLDSPRTLAVLKYAVLEPAPQQNSPLLDGRRHFALAAAVQSIGAPERPRQRDPPLSAKALAKVLHVAVCV